MATVAPKWETFVVNRSSAWINDDFILRHRVEGRGKNAVDQWQLHQSTTVEIDGSLSYVLTVLNEAAEGLVEPTVENVRIDGTYGDNDYYEVRVSGWLWSATPEQIATAKKSKKEKEERIIEVDRQRAERDIARLRAAHPDLFK